jgi:hypothetical protein
MGEALVTWFEARACAASGSKNLRGGSSTCSALALAELCCQTLLEDRIAAIKAARTQEVTPAFERVVEANTLRSGLGFDLSSRIASPLPPGKANQAPMGTTLKKGVWRARKVVEYIVGYQLRSRVLTHLSNPLGTRPC